MPDDTLNQPTSTPGSEGSSGGGEESSSFGLQDFFSAAGEAPKIESPEYEQDTKSDHITDPGGPNPDVATKPGVVGSDGQEGKIPPQHGQRTIQEIQAHRSAQTRARKFDGLEPDEIPLFKNMSHEAYQKLYPAYLESKKHQARIKELEENQQTLENRRWYEEPDAYTLHPEFRAAQQTVENLSIEEEFWQDQLARIKRGEEWFDLVRDDKGTYRYGNQGHEASPEGEAAIIGNLAKLAQFKMQAGSAVEQIRSNFSSRYKTFNDGLVSADKEMFGKLEMDKNPAVKADYEFWLNRFPKEFRTQLPYQMLAKSAAVIQGLTKILRSKEVESTRKTALKATVVNGGPGSGLAGGSGNQDAKALEEGFGRLTRRNLS